MAQSQAWLRGSDAHWDAIHTTGSSHIDQALGQPPTGKQTTWTIIDVVRVQDGNITKLWHNIPNSDILEQIQPAAQ
jgi:predicted ester cyclase